MTDLELKVVDPTVTGNNAEAFEAYNSYVSLDDALTYWQLRTSDDEFFAQDDNALIRLLVDSFYRLERFIYIGRVTQIYQKTRWPRVAVPNLNGYVYDAHSIPVELIQAQEEEALYNYTYGEETDERQFDRLTGISKEKVDNTSREYYERSGDNTHRFLNCPLAYTYIQHLIATGTKQRSSVDLWFPTQWGLENA